MIAQAGRTPETMASAGKVKVAVRIRPCLPGRAEANEESCVNTARFGGGVHRELVVSVPPLPGAISKPENDAKRFEFDRVFGPQSTQHDLFEHCGKPVLDAAMNGQRATLFAYGRTPDGGSNRSLCWLSPA